MLAVLRKKERCSISILSYLPHPVFQEIYCLHRNLPLLDFLSESSIKLWDFTHGTEIAAQSIANTGYFDLGAQ
jgi:hypothetical protein